MYKITGKQQFGAVWAKGQCLAVFRRGEAHTSDPAKAEALQALGYTVEGEADKPSAPAKPSNQPDEAPSDAPAEPKKASKKKDG